MSSNIRDRLDEMHKNTSTSTSVFVILKERLPTLFDYLIGHPKTSSKPQRHPCTLMVWIDHDMLKWSINCKKEQWTAFGRFQKPVIDLNDLELSLVEGVYELRKR